MIGGYAIEFLLDGKADLKRGFQFRAKSRIFHRPWKSNKPSISMMMYAVIAMKNKNKMVCFALCINRNLLHIW